MMRFATDENFNGKILSKLRKRMPGIDIIRVQDTNMYRSPDPDVLAWAAQDGRILLTHDVQTMPGFVYERVRAGNFVAGVIVVHRSTPISLAIDELEVMIGASSPADFENQVKFIPIR
jgi:hypothetical protein